MRFEEVEREYRSLKQQFDAGTLTEDQFRARLEELMIEDAEGDWWIIGYETGQWYQHDGEQWVRADPPVESAAPDAASTAPAIPPAKEPEPARGPAPTETARPIETATQPIVPLPPSPGTSVATPRQEPGPQRRRSGALVSVIGLVVVGILAGAVYLVLGRSPASPVVPTPTVPAAAAAVVTPVLTETATVAVVAEVSATPAPTETESPPSPTEVPPSPTSMPAATDTPTLEPTATETSAPTPVPPTETPTDTPAPPTATRARPTATLPPADPRIVADFETLGTWRRGNEPYGTLTQVSDPVHDGKFAAKLEYDFPATSVQDSFVVFDARPPRAISGKPTQLSMWVYGDGSGHFLSLWILDSNGEKWSFTFGQVNHAGTWQQMTANLDPTAPWPNGHLDGPDNKQVDYPIRLNSIVLDGVPNGVASKGEIVLDTLTVGGPAVQ